MRVYNYDNEPFDFCRKCSPDWATILEVEDEDLYDVDCQHVDYEIRRYIEGIFRVPSIILFKSTT